MKFMRPEEVLAERLKAAIADKGISIEDLNAEAGLSKTTVNHWMMLDRSPNLMTMLSVANVLDVSIDWLLGREKNYLEELQMNMRQSMRAMSKQMEDMANYNRRAKKDIKAYNACIDGMIAGESPCKWCEEYAECQLQAKDGKGCSEWWLADQDKAQPDDDNQTMVFHGEVEPADPEIVTGDLPE